MKYKDTRLPPSRRLQSAFIYATLPDHVQRDGLPYATMFDTQLGALRLLYEVIPALPEDFACAVLLYPVIAELYALPGAAFGGNAFNYMQKLAAAKPPGALAGAAFEQETDPLVKAFVLAASVASLESLSHTLKTGRASDDQRPVILWAADVLDQPLNPDDLAVFGPEDVEIYQAMVESCRLLSETCRGISEKLETRFTHVIEETRTLLEWQKHRLIGGSSTPS